jgi:hypothetical protein
MRLPIIVTTLTLAAHLLAGQEKPAEAKQEALEAVIIPVKTLSGDSFNRLAKLLSVFNVKYAADDKLRTIVVYAPKEVVAQMRRVVEELDRPGSEAAIGRNIEMTLAFLRCSTKAPPDAKALPADLEPVARQLRAATQYKDIQLWDIVPLHLQEGKSTEQTARLPMTIPDAPGAIALAQLRIVPESVSRKESGRFVRFDALRISFRIPVVVSKAATPHWNYQEYGLNTSGDFKEGQKSVLGKISGIDDDTAIFVVISLRVLD